MGVYRNIGAVAELFDISCLTRIPSLFNQITNGAIAIWKAAPSSVTPQDVIKALGMFNTDVVLGKFFLKPITPPPKNKNKNKNQYTQVNTTTSQIQQHPPASTPNGISHPPPAETQTPTSSQLNHSVPRLLPGAKTSIGSSLPISMRGVSVGIWRMRFIGPILNWVNRVWVGVCLEVERFRLGMLVNIVSGLSFLFLLSSMSDIFGRVGLFGGSIKN
jgi:hypothetical protein